MTGGAIWGCLILAFGVYVTFFTNHYVSRLRANAPVWLRDLMASDIYSLFIWLGGVGFIIAGTIMLFRAVA